MADAAFGFLHEFRGGNLFVNLRVAPVSCRPNRHAMANGPLPELLRDLGVETLLDDPETLHRMAEVALDRAGLAANGRAPEEYRLEVELFEWCTKRLALLTAEDSALHAAAPSTLRH